MSLSNISVNQAINSTNISPKPLPSGVQLNDELDSREEEEVEELKKHENEVKRHERAHVMAAGSLAKSAPRYDYIVGPDGRRYVISGTVSLDTSEVPNDPEMTVAKAQKIKRAALAPMKPSSQDRRVAAEAYRMELEARQEVREENAKEKEEDGQNTTGIIEEIPNLSKKLDIDAAV